MKDMQAHLEKLRSDAAECALISNLATNQEKKELFARLAEQSRSRKTAQYDKWNFCLTTAIIAANRRDYEQKTAPEPLTGLQGEGGYGGHQG